jgi:4-hydroxy-tetrahydrodipicolinate reductase
MRVALIGYGNMGKEVERLARGRGIEIGPIFTSKNNSRAKGLTKDSLKGADLCIDFSTPPAVLRNIEAVARSGKNIVVGTTGWYGRMPSVRRIIRSCRTGLLYSPNFSIGMNMFMSIVAAAAGSLDVAGLYDAAIHEVHHRKKADSPSGSALVLGRIILERVKAKKRIVTGVPRSPLRNDQLLISSSRVGNVAGTHTVLLDSEADAIELTHRAKNRSGFAYGALRAAEWLKGKRGIFTMDDLLSSP